jgi:hypothetical protein
MPLFRRESLHQRLAREGGLGEPPPHDTRPSWGEVGIHGVARPREWDGVATAEAPDLTGDAVDSDAVGPLADALEGVLEPPYRAQAVRRSGGTWAVGARSIEVAELADDVEGDEILLSVAQGERSLLVDGLPGFGSIPVLERLGAQRYESYVVRAERLDERLWEVKVSPL